MLLEAESTLRDDRGAARGIASTSNGTPRSRAPRPSRPKTILRDMVTGDGVFLDEPAERLCRGVGDDVLPVLRRGRPCTSTISSGCRSGTVWRTTRRMPASGF